MNEPALTDRLRSRRRHTARHDHAPTPSSDPDGPDGAPIPHAVFHNAYGMQMARATREGLERLRPNERAFVLTRAGYAGIQRYAAIWTGDNHSRWEHLRLAARMCLSIGMSGTPLTGFDTGGFWDAPTGEMLMRFTQLGALFPFFRNHCALSSRRRSRGRWGSHSRRSSARRSSYATVCCPTSTRSPMRRRGRARRSPARCSTTGLMTPPSPGWMTSSPSGRICSQRQSSPQSSASETCVSQRALA